jgi:excisionase family DNA binding protein
VSTKQSHSQQDINYPTPRLLRIKQAATYLGGTEWFVRTLIWGREIPFLKLGKRLLLDRSDLDRYIDSQKERAQ